MIYLKNKSLTIAFIRKEFRKGYRTTKQLNLQGWCAVVVGKSIWVSLGHSPAMD